jgi:hypothetical protein
MNPFFRAPAELMANQSFWDDKPLDRQSSSTIGALLDPEGPTGKAFPKAVREWLGYQKTVFPSGREYHTFDGQKFYLLFRTWHVSRFISSSDSWFNRAARDTSFAANLLAMTTSLKAMEVNLDDKRRQVLRRRIEQIEREMVRQSVAGETKRIFEKKNVPGRYRQVR